MPRNLALAERNEEVRDKLPGSPAVQFELDEIKQRFDQSVAAIQSQFGIADKLASDGNIADAQNIWRAQWVFLEGILDFFIHEVTKYCLYQMFCGLRDKTLRYHALKVNIDKVEFALSASGQREWFFSYINDSIARECYLGAETFKDQMNLIGANFEQIACCIYPDSAIRKQDAIAMCKKDIQSLYDRRNRIAHQLDHNHETAVQDSISKVDVENAMQKIISIAAAIISGVQAPDIKD